MTTDQRQILNQAYQIGRDLGRKFEREDLMGNATLMQAARLYAEQYEGTFSYMLEMRQQVLINPMLSHGQAKGVLNVMMADARKRVETKPAAAAAPTTPPTGGLNVTKVANGRYRVVLSADDSLSIRLEKSPFEDKPAGSRMIAVLADGDQWIGQAGVDPDGSVRFWRKAGDRVKAAVEILTKTDDSLVFGLAYAMHGSVCFFCGRALDTAESITVGYGPVCAEKNELPWGAKAVPMKVLLARAAGAGVEGIVPPARAESTEDLMEQLRQTLDQAKDEAFARAGRR